MTDKQPHVNETPDSVAIGKEDVNNTQSDVSQGDTRSADQDDLLDKELELILGLYRRDIERHYGGRTVGKTLSAEEAKQALRKHELQTVLKKLKKIDVNVERDDSNVVIEMKASRVYVHLKKVIAEIEKEMEGL